MKKRSRDNRKLNAKAIKCPHCGSDLFRRNGSYKTTRRKRVSRFTCRKCEKPWEDPAKLAGLLDGFGFYDAEASVLQSFALLAEGLPLDQVEGLVHRKSETIRARLLRCFDEEGSGTKSMSA